MRFRQDERGQMLILTAVCMAMMMGFVALAVDVGLLFRAKRNAQIAADSAATAAALDYLHNNSIASAQTAGQAAAARNGITNGDANGDTVTINIPSTDPATSSVNGSAEAIVSQPNPTFFLGAFKKNKTTVAVAAKAVAATTGIGTGCIWLMNPTGTGLKLWGSDNLTTNCGIYVNSDTSDALVKGGQPTINISGGGFFDIVYNGSVPSFRGSNIPLTGAAARTDPFGNLTGQVPAAACTGSNTVTAATVTAALLAAKPPLAGVVCFSATNVTLSTNLPGAAGPGVVYLFEGTGSVLGSVSLGTGNCTASLCTTTNGAVMDLYNGTMDPSSNFTIYAPTTGTYNAIAILQPPLNTTPLAIETGNSSQVLDGYIYAPGAEVVTHDQGGGLTAGGIVAAWLGNVKNGNPSTIVINSYDALNPTTSPNQKVILVE